MARTFCAIFILFISLNLQAFDKNEFRRGLLKQQAIYTAFTSQQETGVLFSEGKSKEANRRLKALVPDNKKTAYDYFILGNMLFTSDREASYMFMSEAEKRAPNNPYILFERGIHEHRLGNYAIAQKYYEKSLDSGFEDGNPLLSAYLTHTYLMNGDVDNALVMWKKANFGRNHTLIEKSMYTIFSEVNQEGLRAQLISEIKSGAKLKLCDLYQLDSRWEIDWWNHKPKKSYLEYDLKLAEAVLANDPINAKYFQLCSLGDAISDEMFVTHLKEVGFFNGSAELPESSSLIYEMVKRVNTSNIISTEEFLDRYEDQLVAFSEKHPKDRKYYDVLAFLYANSGNKVKLRSIDLYGWKTLKVEKYALSYIVGLDPKSENIALTVNEALKDFPLSASLNQYKLVFETQNKKDALIRYAASEFSNVKNNWSGPYRLNDFMASLSHELSKLEP